MNIEEQGVISEGKSYEIEFSRAEEVAEFGEMASVKKVSLPSVFDINDSKAKEWMLKTFSRIASEQGYDTFVVTETTFKDYLFHKVVETK